VTCYNCRSWPWWRVARSRRHSLARLGGARTRAGFTRDGRRYYGLSTNEDERNILTKAHQKLTGALAVLLRLESTPNIRAVVESLVAVENAVGGLLSAQFEPFC
jgi:hypothetical protein